MKGRRPAWRPRGRSLGLPGLIGIIGFIGLIGFIGVTWRPRELSKSDMSRVIIRVTPFRVLVALLMTHLLSPLGLQGGASKSQKRFGTQGLT